MFKVNNKNTRTRCEICSKVTIKTFIVNLEHISHFVLVFLLLICSSVSIVNFEKVNAGWVS